MIEITPELVADHGLSPDEYEQILELLGREPTFPELGVFSAMWSEHCGYKNSRPHLETLPTEGPLVVQGPGENAGVIDAGDGWGVAFKIESHNHPSAVEPYQGAATGSGGILRDVFTMGARPIAILDSLHFGSLDSPRSRYLLDGVVRGVGDYGNCVGVPTVGGEAIFDPSYERNPIINVMCVGILRLDDLMRGKAEGVGNAVMAVGARTGRDGIHGATFASVELDEGSDSRPQVQVGDPFTEKLLLEASLELIRLDLLVGIQDMGAAGLTSSGTEMAARSGSGIDIDVALVPVREPGMTPYEILLSESQERMLLVAKPGCESSVADVLSKWDLEAAVVGRVTDDGFFRVRDGGEVVVEIPVQPLVNECPTYTREGVEDPEVRRLRELDTAEYSAPISDQEAADALLTLLDSPSLASCRWIYEQYDTTVGTNTVVGPGSDAAVLRLADSGTRHRRFPGLQRALRLLGAAPRSEDRHGGSREKRGLQRRSSGRDHQLPELRESPQAGHVLPLRRSRGRSGRRMPGPLDARHRGQRLLLQRDAGRSGLPDARHRDDRAPPASGPGGPLLLPDARERCRARRGDRR